jgi:hypothetical protein
MASSILSASRSDAYSWSLLRASWNSVSPLLCVPSHRKTMIATITHTDTSTRVHVCTNSTLNALHSVAVSPTCDARQAPA